MPLSKSDYTLYLKHPAWLWLKKHDPDKLPKHDENTQALFDAGNLFESYAQQIFSESVKLGFSHHDESKSYGSLPDRTKQALDDASTVN